MKQMRPRPRATGKQNPAMKGYQSPTPPQEANARQLVPQQLSAPAPSQPKGGKSAIARSYAAKRMMR